MNEEGQRVLNIPQSLRRTQTGMPVGQNHTARLLALALETGMSCKFRVEAGPSGDDLWLRVQRDRAVVTWQRAFGGPVSVADAMEAICATALAALPRLMGIPVVVADNDAVPPLEAPPVPAEASNCNWSPASEPAAQAIGAARPAASESL